MASFGAHLPDIPGCPRLWITGREVRWHGVMRFGDISDMQPGDEREAECDLRQVLDLHVSDLPEP